MYIRLFFVISLSFILLPIMAQNDKKQQSSSSPNYTDVDKFYEQQNSQFDIFINQQNEDFDSFIQQKQKEFDEFLDSINRDFVKYLAGDWKTVRLSGRVRYEKDKEIKPIIREEKEDEPQKDRIIQGEIISIVKESKPQPEPIVPIQGNKLVVNYNSFSFYGTPMKVRWGDAQKFKFTTLNNKEIANAYERFSSDGYKNLLSDCLVLRKKYQLCDWAYYKMLESLSTTIFGKRTNEAIFLQGVLYGKSGYMMRFAVDKKANKLHLLCAMRDKAYNFSYYHIDGKDFFLFDKSKPGLLDYCPKGYAGEQEMTLDIDQLPLLNKNLSEERIIKARTYPLMTKTCMNKNLIDFFNDYPTGYKNNNFMTRWAYYANTPVSDEIRNGLYPQIREKIQNLPPLTAANMLLNWIQPLPDGEQLKPENKEIGLHYAKDDDMWGIDRAFFAEESLYYPLSDCEDHAILYSHLVRDLLRLDVALVYYPGHLSTAICFDADVKGDGVMVEKRRFTVADPTSRGKVGTTMYQFRNTNPKEIKVILLER